MPFPNDVEGGMQNIPTDLLRTLVAVVNLRSFTKAAQSLGVTQPAVSAQVKRLQFLLGYELLDRQIACERECAAAWVAHQAVLLLVCWSRCFSSNGL